MNNPENGRPLGPYLLEDRRKKLTDQQVAEIRAQYWDGGRRQQDLAAQYGVSQTAISLIVHYRSRRVIRGGAR